MILNYELRKSIVFMNTSSRVRQCATVFSILSLFNYPLNKVVFPAVSTVYSPIMLSKGIYTIIRVHETKINTIREIDTVTRAEKLPAEHGLSCWKTTQWTRFIFSVYPVCMRHQFNFKQWKKCWEAFYEKFQTMKKVLRSILKPICYKCLV